MLITEIEGENLLKIKVGRRKRRGYVWIESFRKLSTIYTLVNNKLGDRTFATVLLKSPIENEIYIRGLKHYIEWFITDRPENVNGESIWETAVVSYYLKSTLTLKKVDDLLNLQGDDYFPLYLSHNFKLFYSTMNVEMVRRKVLPIEDLKLITIDKSMEYQTLASESYMDGYIPPIEDINQSQVRIFSTRHFNGFIGSEISRPPLEMIEELYGTRTVLMVKAILSVPGVLIAGGFVNSLVNPSYKYVELKDPEIARYVEQAIVNLYKSKGFPEYKIYDKLNDLLADYPMGLKSILYDGNLVDEYIGNYYIEHEGVKYIKVFNKSSDIDLFFYGNDHEQTALRVYKEIRNLKYTYYEEYESPDSDYYKYSKYLLEYTASSSDEFKLQFVKKKYSSIKQILAGFDVDPSAVGLYVDENGKAVVKGTMSYINSVIYGLNLIVPTRQSLTFNHRILKYMEKGYQPFLPGGIQSRFYSTLFEEEPEKIDQYTFRELWFKYKNIGLELWPSLPNGIENYNARAASYLIKEEPWRTQIIQGRMNGEERMVKILEGKLTPQFSDVIYLLSLRDIDGMDIRQRYAMNELFLGFGWSRVNGIDSLNPTKVDYFGPKNKRIEYEFKEELKSDEELRALLSEITISPLSRIIQQYELDNWESLYFKILNAIPSLAQEDAPRRALEFSFSSSNVWKIPDIPGIPLTKYEESQNRLSEREQQMEREREEWTRLMGVDIDEYERMMREWDMSSDLEEGY